MNNKLLFLLLLSITTVQIFSMLRDYNQKNAYGHTILHYTTCTPEVFSALYNVTFNNDEHFDIKMAEYTKAAILQGASISISDNDGKTPFDRARENALRLPRVYKEIWDARNKERNNFTVLDYLSGQLFNSMNLN